MEEEAYFEEHNWFSPPFLSLMSHELRSPLQTINGYLDLTLSGLGGELNVQQQEFLSRARISGERMAALIDDLLLFARFNAHQLGFAIYETDLVLLIHECVEALRLFAEKTQVHLHTRLPRVLPHVWADSVRMTQLLRNLLTNALLFTPAGGTVSMRAKIVPASVQPLNERLAGVMLLVQDTGVGISPADQTRIFEPFFRGDVSDKRLNHEHTRGVGLGLTCAKIIAAGHSGAICMQRTSQASQQHGTTFSVWLPLKAEVEPKILATLALS